MSSSGGPSGAPHNVSRISARLRNVLPLPAGPKSNRVCTPNFRQSLPRGKDYSSTLVAWLRHLLRRITLLELKSSNHYQPDPRQLPTAPRRASFHCAVHALAASLTLACLAPSILTAPASSERQALEQMKVADGFAGSLVAHEPDIPQ